jgi:hypothetical protein
MNPGPELDRLIAEKVMGEAIPPGAPLLCADSVTTWSPSTDIAHAVCVAEPLRLMIFPHHDGGWCAARAEEYGVENNSPAHGDLWIDDGISHYAHAETIPHAVCLAALSVVGVKA